MHEIDAIKKEEWDDSYRHKDNFVFYPENEVIRFVAKYIKRREDIDSYRTIRPGYNRGLDLGCGIGRHVLFLDDYGFESYGIDLSSEAIKFAIEYCAHLNKDYLKDRFTIGSITDMPYADGFFDFMVSHGVLDSMPFSIAKMAMQAVCRVLRKGGLFYLDLIAPNGVEFPTEYGEEVQVEHAHEQGTIQSYFNWTKILELFDNRFDILDAKKVTSESVTKIEKNSRWHLVIQKL